MKDQESVLEIGFVLAAIGVAVAVSVWLLGNAMSARHHAGRYAEEPPLAGSIEPERHQHISTVAAR